jgi:hypothetical protein
MHRPFTNFARTGSCVRQTKHTEQLECQVCEQTAQAPETRVSFEHACRRCLTYSPAPSADSEYTHRHNVASHVAFQICMRRCDRAACDTVSPWKCELNSVAVHTGISAHVP